MALGVLGTADSGLGRAYCPLTRCVFAPGPGSKFLHDEILIGRGTVALLSGRLRAS